MKRTILITLAAGLVPLAAHAQTMAPATATAAKPATAPAAAAPTAMPAAAPAAMAPAAAPTAATINNVAAAQKAAKDAKVILEGNLVRVLEKDRYEFRDATGTMNVEIDKKYLPTAKFDAKTKVRITGEVGHDKSGIEISAKKVEILS